MGRSRRSTAGHGRDGGGALERLAGGKNQPLDKPRDCTLAVGRDAAVHARSSMRMALALVVRRESPRPIGRVCRVQGCTPHLEIHAPRGDVLFEFDSVEERNRVAEALGNPTFRS